MRSARFYRWLPLLAIFFAVGGWLTLRASRANPTISAVFQAEEGLLSNAPHCTDTSLTQASFVRLSGQCAQGSRTFYGVPWYGYSLNNFVIGKDDYRAAYRFKAAASQAIDSVKYYVVFTDSRPGYNAGNCGDLRVSITRDSGPPNHQPADEPLGSYVITDPCGPNEFGQKPTFPRHGFTPQVILEKDALYHVTFTNIDPSMDANWVSVNGMYDYSNHSPRQRGASDEDFAVLTSTDGGQSWNEHTKDTPILEIAFADGTVQGQSYMEFDYDSNESTDLSPGQAVRQVIKPTDKNITVQALHIRAGQSDWSNQEYPQSRGTLAIKSENGTVLAESAFVPYEGTDFWTTIPLPGPITLVKDTTYYLELTAQSGNLMFVAMQKGTTYQFDAALGFTDGYMEINKTGTWAAYTDEGKSESCKCHDLSFYFEVNQ